MQISVGTSPKQVLILLATGVVLAGLGTHYVGEWWERRQMVKNAVEPIQAKVISTSGILADQAISDVQRQALEQTLAEARESFKNDYRKAKSEKPEIADRASRDVPDGLRNLYRQRRLSRERSACAEAGCRSGFESTDTAKR